MEKAIAKGISEGACCGPGVSQKFALLCRLRLSLQRLRITESFDERSKIDLLVKIRFHHHESLKLAE